MAQLSTDPASRSSRRPITRVLIVGALLLIVAWLALAVVQLLSARTAAEAGLDALEDAPALSSSGLSGLVDEIDSDAGGAPSALRADIATATEEFTAANDHLRSPAVRLLQFAPVLGRQIRAAEELTDAAVRVTTATGEAIDELHELAPTAASAPGQRVELAHAAERVLQDFTEALEGVTLTEPRALLGPLRDAYQTFGSELDDVTSTARNATTAVTGIAVFLEGPTRNLVFAANNSEMRAGSGMFLQAGTMDVADGQFSLSAFELTGDIYLDSPGAALDPDVAALWGDLLPTQEWRNINLTPRFDVTGQAAADMWSASGRGDVDGVMAVDVIGLRSLLEVVGPVTVEVDGAPTTISADNVANELLLNQYKTFDQDRDERREQLGRVAAGVFDAFNSSNISVTDLLSSLQNAGEGRHLLMWSSVPEVQAAWEALGVAGAIPENSLLLSVSNRGGNKLDQFLEIDASLEARSTDDGTRVTVRATFTNSAPVGLPSYVEGPHPDGGLAAGEYYGLVTLAMPAGAGNVSVTGGTITALGPDGPTRVAVAPLRLGRGAVAELSFEFDLPSGWTSLDVLPSARVPAIAWTAGGESWEDGAPREVELSALT